MSIDKPVTGLGNTPPLIPKESANTKAEKPSHEAKPHDVALKTISSTPTVPAKNEITATPTLSEKIEDTTFRTDTLAKNIEVDSLQGRKLFPEKESSTNSSDKEEIELEESVLQETDDFVFPDEDIIQQTTLENEIKDQVLETTKEEEFQFPDEQTIQQSTSKDEESKPLELQNEVIETQQKELIQEKIKAQASNIVTELKLILNDNNRTTFFKGIGSETINTVNKINSTNSSPINVKLIELLFADIINRKAHKISDKEIKLIELEGNNQEDQLKHLFAHADAIVSPNIKIVKEHYKDNFHANRHLYAQHMNIDVEDFDKIKHVVLNDEAWQHLTNYMLTANESFLRLNQKQDEIVEKNRESNQETLNILEQGISSKKTIAKKETKPKSKNNTFTAEEQIHRKAVIEKNIREFHEEKREQEKIDRKRHWEEQDLEKDREKFEIKKKLKTQSDIARTEEKHKNNHIKPDKGI